VLHEFGVKVFLKPAGKSMLALLGIDWVPIVGLMRPISNPRAKAKVTS